MSYSAWLSWVGFAGRLTRGSFWWRAVAAWLVFAILCVFLDGSRRNATTWILYPPLLWILVSLLVRRLHDRGHSAWRLLLVLIPIIGPLYLAIALAFGKGTDGDNQYGPDPRLVNVDYLTVK